MRLFIGIERPAGARRAAAEDALALQRAGARGRFAPPETYHVTLHFIGESGALPELADAMRAAARDCRPFTLRIGGYGAFPGRAGETGYLCAACATGELARLHETLEAALCDRGFGRGRGHLVPHVTLGRNITGAVPELCAAQAAFSVRHITLFESRRERGGLVYAPLHREPFA